MLTQTLRDLQRDGYLTRTVYPTQPPSVEYAADAARPLLPCAPALAGAVVYGEPRLRSGPPASVYDAAKRTDNPASGRFGEGGMKRLDIGIAGAGPAGLAAALFLARAGHRVDLIERFDQPVAGRLRPADAADGAHGARCARPVACDPRAGQPHRPAARRGCAQRADRARRALRRAGGRPLWAGGAPGGAVFRAARCGGGGRACRSARASRWRRPRPGRPARRCTTRTARSSATTTW
jgi:hypothetical protein